MASPPPPSPSTGKTSSPGKRKFMLTQKRVATIEAWMREMEAAFLRETKTLHERISSLEEERKGLQERILLLEGKPAREEGEIIEADREAIKEEITKALEETLEKQIDAKKDGWVEVVKKNLKKEAKEEAQKDEAVIIHTTIEEEKMRHARRLNIRVTGIAEETGSTPENDGKTLCKKLGYK
eukprot:c24701_g2_i1 orf=107-652(+)